MKSGNPQDFYLKITFEAKDDLVNIFNYTFRKYGKIQLETYSAEIDASLMFLKINPKAGFSRSDIPELYKSYPVGQHIIIYRIENQIIYIIRVLHKKMNFNFQF